LLDQAGVPYTYREYTREPLGEDELREVLGMLGSSPRDVLRAADAKKAGLTGGETDDELIRLMAGNPRLLQRPIGVLGGRAVLGRPPEQLLALLKA
jgi:arsenate reductase (glutaredoxin)